tara:strand:- start:2939 stop:4381 length:1443 start_codon:yes stop_codon:yes gene_type:complete
MKLFISMLFSVILLSVNIVIAEEKIELADYISQCKKDLDFFRESVKKNSSVYTNKSDTVFQAWFNKGYEDTLELINAISDKNDCNYAMKYYINGFNQSHIALRSYIPLPVEQYPGFLSVKKGADHVVMYKHSALKEYLKNMSVGDKITHINDVSIDKYYKDYILPFYAADNSELTLTSSSIYAFILDGNRFKPVARSVTFVHNDESVKINLKYTELKGSALAAVKQVRQPVVSDSFKVEMVSDGVWIRIPSFFPSRQEVVYYTGMLSTLKKELSKEDYILFDLRGNRGGDSKWSRSIIRNLWGDEFIKSLGKGHTYNSQWKKLLRVSTENFTEFKNTYGAAASATYAAALKKGEDYFLKKWSIFRDKNYLYTNKDNSKFNAKIYVLTDQFCRSTCWTFVNELKQMPNVVHLGQTTTIQSVYSHAKQVRAPSEHFDFFYPTQIRVQPEYKLYQPLVPSEIYEDNFRDEASLINWVLSITEK